MLKASLLATLFAFSPTPVGIPGRHDLDFAGAGDGAKKLSEKDYPSLYAYPETENDSFSDAISCLAKGMDEEGVLYEEDVAPYDKHEILTELRFPLKKAQRDSLVDLDYEYSEMVNEKVDQLKKSSRGAYDKVAEEIFNKMVAIKMLRLPQNAKKANQIKNLIAQDVRWEVLKQQNIEKMLEKCLICHQGTFYLLGAEKTIEERVVTAFKKACVDDANYKDMREVLANPYLREIVFYTSSKELFGDNKIFFSNLGLDASHAGGVVGMTIPKIFMQAGEPAVGLNLAINLQTLNSSSLIRETLIHEKDHAKHILRNGLPIDYMSNPMHHSPEKEEQFRRDIKRCSRDLEYAEKITPWEASQIWTRLLNENDTAEGLAETIEHIPSEFLQKYCRKIFEFSFGDPSKLRDCKGEVSSAQAESLSAHERAA